MKKLSSIAGFLIVSACGLTELPQGNCGDGYVTHTSPAGTERCIKPGMAVGTGVVVLP